MKTGLILIILSSIQLGICSNLFNLTYDDNYAVCPINFLRKKRTLPDYTRWRANAETTPEEFIVKVLDDELATPKMIVAINIQPVTKRGEKIIVGGVKIPPITTSQTAADQARDYTRFVPPTTVPVSMDEELYLAPARIAKGSDKITPIKPKFIGPIRGRNSQRDESPASPLFLARTPADYPRQFVPITPVAFTHRSTNTPFKPSTATASRTSIQFPIEPSRTSALPEATSTEDTYDDVQNFGEDEEDSSVMLARTTLSSVYLKKKSTTDISLEEENENHDNNEKNTGEDEIFVKDSRKINNKADESDAFYNMLFYNDEETESSSKKNELGKTEYYDDKSNHFIFDTPIQNVKVTNTQTENVATKTITTTDLDNTNDTTSKNKFRGKRRQMCNLLKLRQLNFNSPRTLPEIVSQLKQWAETSPVAKWEDITRGNYTNMDNPIHVMIVDDPSTGQIVSAKQTAMIVAGIQGRDHHAVAAAMYVLYQLIERSEAHADLLTKYRFWIIPVLNPDGYDYSMTFPHRREWRKNLRQYWDNCQNRDSCVSCEAYGLRCSTQPCYGVNLDRNFEYQWIPTEELRAEHSCGALHSGARQLSEAETWALTRFLHQQRTPLFTFIAFKEGEVLGVMYPYSHTKKKRAFDHVYRQRATRASSAAFSISGRPYVAGQTSEFLPLYAGGIEDWVDGHLGIDNTYTIMMFRLKDTYNTKLVTERVVHEAYAAMDTLLLQSLEPIGSPPVALKTVSGSPRLFLHCYTISLIIVIFTIR